MISLDLSKYAKTDSAKKNEGCVYTIKEACKIGWVPCSNKDWGSQFKFYLTLVRMDKFGRYHQNVKTFNISNAHTNVEFRLLYYALTGESFAKYSVPKEDFDAVVSSLCDKINEDKPTIVIKWVSKTKYKAVDIKIHTTKYKIPDDLPKPNCPEWLIPYLYGAKEDVKNPTKHFNVKKDKPVLGMDYEDCGHPPVDTKSIML